MKRKFIIPVLILLISANGLAQKSQIKTAQSEFNNGKLQEALTTLKETQYLITNAEDNDKSDFFYLKAKVFTGLANNNIETVKNLSLAISTYQELIEEEVASGNLKYAVQAKSAIKEIKDNLDKSASDDVKNNKFVDAANKMYYLYQLDKKDTLSLFNSASYFLNSKDYDSALKSYNELKKINYSGKGLAFYAVNKQTKVEEIFLSAKERDLSIKEGSHEKPRNFMSPSKKTEIYKNMAYIYSEKGNLDEAEECYKKLLDFDPRNADAYINLAYLKLDKKKILIEEMSILGTTPKEMKIYDELKIKKDQLLKSAVAYLEKGNIIEPKNTDISKLLLNLYRALDLTAEYNALKAKI